MPTLQFGHSLNVSVQPGDTIYACSVENRQSGRNHPTAGSADTKPKKIGTVSQVIHGSNKLFFNMLGGATTPGPGSYFMFSKDNRVNTSGIIGYYAEVEFKNMSSKQSEVFAVAVDYVESSK